MIPFFELKNSGLQIGTALHNIALLYIPICSPLFVAMCYPHAYGGYASVRWYASPNPVHTPVSFTPDWHETRVMHIICTLEIRERHY